MKDEYAESRGFLARHAREYQTSEDEESRSSGGCTKKTKQAETSNATDGASIEVVRRPRGRPPGSKNKPKPPLIITRETTDSTMHPHVLELPGGIDIVDAIARFARRRNVGLCVLTGTGTVANVTLRQSTSALTGGGSAPSTVTFHGRFDILSISATFLPSSVSSQLSNGFKISLAGSQGQIVGGSVVGSLLAAGTVVIVAATFSNPTFHVLPGEDEASTAGIAAGVGHAPDTMGLHQNTLECSSGMSVYSCHLPSDVIWAPTPRQPQHPTQPF